MTLAETSDSAPTEVSVSDLPPRTARIVRTGIPVRAAFERIVREYPRSDEAALAREQLRTLGK